jgi:nucleoid DNA-binding protein
MIKCNYKQEEKNMNKTQLIECVAVEANLTKKVAGEAVDAVFTVLTKALK